MRVLKDEYMIGLISMGFVYRGNIGLERAYYDKVYLIFPWIDTSNI
jgi:hypothetical protein